MQTFLRLLAFGSSLLVCFFFRTMKMMILMMMSILLTENTTAKEKKKKRRKRSSYFLTNTHTHTPLSLSLSLCVCVCVGFSLKTLSRGGDCCTRTILYRTSDEKRKKDILPRKRKERKTCTRIRVEYPKQKNRQKSLRTKMHRRETRRDRLV